MKQVEAIIKPTKLDEVRDALHRKIFVLPVEGVIRIRTGERGSKAL